MGTVLAFKDVTEDHALTGTFTISVLWEKLALTLFVLLTKALEHFRLPILVAVLSGEDHHVHAEAFLVHSPSGYQVAAERTVFGQIGSEVHFLPLKFFAEAVLPRETKFPQVPSLDEVDLAILRALVDFLRVSATAKQEILRVQRPVCFVVAEQKSVFFTSQPSRFSREPHDFVCVQRGSCIWLAPCSTYDSCGS